MDVDKQLDQSHLDHLAAMRAAFTSGRHEDVLKEFEQLAPLNTLRSGIRIEAIALAARTHLASGDRKTARELLKQIWEAPQKSPRLYRYVAIACLEFGDYRRALSVMEKAIALADASKPAPQQE